MVGVVVAAHAGLAEALLDAASLVVPDVKNAVAVGIAVEDDAGAYGERLKSSVERMMGAQGVLILTDMFGGTPSNVGLTLHDRGRVEVLTGANLPMLIKALHLSSRDLTLAEMAKQVRQAGQQAISVASEVLAPETTVAEEPT